MQSYKLSAAKGNGAKGLSSAPCFARYLLCVHASKISQLERKKNKARSHTFMGEKKQIGEQLQSQ